MISKLALNDEQTAAKLLWQLKAIATKEVENVSIPYSCIDSFFLDPVVSLEGRGRTISFESADIAVNSVTPVLSYVPKTIVEPKPFLLDIPRDNAIDHLDHHNWGPPRGQKPPRPSLINVGEEGRKASKRKRESHVGLITKSGIIRSTLRKKFSWKQYPEVSSSWYGKVLSNVAEYLTKFILVHPRICSHFSWKITS